MTDFAKRTLTISAAGVSSCTDDDQVNTTSKLELPYPNYGERQALNVRTKRTQVGSKKGGQHVNSFVHQVDCGAAGSSFVVHGVVRVHEM